MNQGTVQYRRDGAVAHVLFDRPLARNAMTWTMYEELAVICQKVNEDPGLRAVTFRGVGGKAFIAGTDIAQFQTFTTGEDGVDYERKGDTIMAAIEAIRVPTPRSSMVGAWEAASRLRRAAT
jgi:enoyl-CoA hydratase/carnithine racemase